MANDLISTALMDDPDPDGTDVYGMIPLIAELPGDDDDEEDEYDESGADEEDRPPVIKASSLDIEIPEGEELPDDDDEAFEELTEPGGVSPGEAKSLITYMRPLSEDEREIAADPFLNDLRWVDDPSHTDDLLKEGKGDKGFDDFLDDASYGEEHMKTPEERAERFGDDKILNVRRVVRPSPVKVSAKTINSAVVSGLRKKLVVEHANWLAGKDQEMGITVRPRSYYENVARLWSNDKLKKAQLPTTTTSGGWAEHPAKIARTSQIVLNSTQDQRLRFSPVLGDEVDMGGWSPFKAIKHAVSSATSAVTSTAKYGLSLAEKGGSLAYRGAKFGLTKPFEYTYKGIKFVGKQAMRLALAPIKMVIGRFRNKMVNRKAAELAKQRGLSAPGPAENADALAWTKKTTASSGNKFARMSVSLMGASEYGMKNVDISRGDDEMGLFGIDDAVAYPLIILGAVGLAVILDQIYKAAFKSHGGPAASPQDPGNQDVVIPQDAGAPDAGYPQNASAPDAGYPDAGDPGPDPYAEQYDSSGRTYTLEQLNAMPRKQSTIVQQLIRSGRARLA
jgi:hypothetical protein